MSAVGAVENRGVVGLTSPLKRLPSPPRVMPPFRALACSPPSAALARLGHPSSSLSSNLTYREAHMPSPLNAKSERATTTRTIVNTMWHVHVIHEHRNTNEDKCNTGETERAQHHARRGTTPQTNRTETIHLAHVSHASPHKTANSSSSSKRMLPSSAHHARIDRRRISILGTIQLTHRGPRRERRSAGVHTPRWNSLLLLRRLLLL